MNLLGPLPAVDPHKTLLTFVLFDREHGDQVAHVDPQAVISVVEGRRRDPNGVWFNTAALVLWTGTEHVVMDHDRRVGQQIRIAIARWGTCEAPARETTT